MKKLIYLIVLIIAFGLIVSGCLPVVPPAEQDESSSLTKGGTTWTVGPSGCHFTTIQAAIIAANPNDIINVAAGTYNETLNLGSKGLSIIGDSVDTVTIDASLLAGYAIHSFGNNTTIKNLKLIGTSNSYGFKVSHVNNILLENIKVDSSFKTGVDLHTVTNSELKDIEVINTPYGFGIMILDSDNINISNIKTENNYWGGTSVQTAGKTSDGVVFSGTFEAYEIVPFMVEQDPPGYYDITNLVAPSCFNYIVYAYRDAEGYKQSTYKKTLTDAQFFAKGLIMLTGYSNIMIYDLVKANYYVIEGMLIRDAINDATAGDTINVAAGTYINDIWDSSLGTPAGYRITKSITLLGAQAGNDPAGSTDRGGETILVRTNGLPYSLYAPNITIDGFMFGSSGADTGGRLIISDVADNAIIRNCIIQNTPSLSSGHGVYIYSGADNALVEYNTFYKTAWEAVASWQVSGAVISHNHIDTCGIKGGIHAIQMMGHAGSNNVITYNHISGMTNSNAIQYWGGPGVTISYNVIVGGDTMYDGIWLDKDADGSTVSDNQISDTIYAGINIRGDCTNAFVTLNDISGCGTGVDVVGTITGTVINFNVISGNDMGVANYYSTDTVNAIYNWWGDCSGPTHAGNPDGIGDAVSSNVDYDPWLGKQLCELKSAIAALPNDNFNKPSAANDQRQALLDKIDAVCDQYDDSSYWGALNKLQHDVIKKIEKWIVDSGELVGMVNAEIMILENFL